MKEHPNGAVKGATGIEGLGERLKCVREMRKLTQRALAARSGLRSAAISHFETGQRRPSVQNLRKLCLALDCSADYLLDSH